MEQRFDTLAGLRILVVEDEAMIAMMLEVMLEDFGCRVVGLAPSLEKALVAIRQPALDGVLLDMNMHGKSTDAVAKELLGRTVPFLLVTGYVTGKPIRLLSGQRHV
jgi:CheY-like chemotaxis protein